jgi:protein-tyrosine phosphatase
VLSLNGIAGYVFKTYQRVITTCFDDCLTLPAETYLYSLADLGIALWKDGPILVHCAAGMNRSGLIVGLMLVRSGMMTSKEAIDTMRVKRSNSVLHNPAFRKWLLTQ